MIRALVVAVIVAGAAAIIYLATRESTPPDSGYPPASEIRGLKIN